MYVNVNIDIIIIFYHLFIRFLQRLHVYYSNLPLGCYLDMKTQI